MDFEWDTRKNQLNIQKHGISFEQACDIFKGFVIQRVDDRFEYGETRYISVGRIGTVTIAAVVHTDRSGKTRIISARPAKRKERAQYEKALLKTLNS